MSNTPSTPPPPDGPDPSMEDILASIRRILNEDETTPEGEQTAEAPAGEDLLVLDPSMMVASHPPAAAVQPEPEPEPPAPVPVPQPAPPPEEIEAFTPPPPQVAVVGFPAERDLMAPEAAAAAASSVGNLVRTLAAGRPIQVYSGGPTLEEIVRSELRPMLKQWLDVNLPPVVERLVRAEIERVVGRAVP